MLNYPNGTNTINSNHDTVEKQVHLSSREALLHLSKYILYTLVSLVKKWRGNERILGSIATAPKCGAPLVTCSESTIIRFETSWNLNSTEATPPFPRYCTVLAFVLALISRSILPIGRRALWINHWRIPRSHSALQNLQAAQLTGVWAWVGVFVYVARCLSVASSQWLFRTNVHRHTKYFGGSLRRFSKRLAGSSRVH